MRKSWHSKCVEEYLFVIIGEAETHMGTDIGIVVVDVNVKREDGI